MKINSLGNTDIHISQIGLGTVKFGRNQNIHYPHAFELPHHKDIKNLLDHAHALGINLLDTAPAYGSSEERLGQILTQRQDWVICTKVGEDFHDGISTFDFSANAVESSIERSLKRLRTDYLDIVLVHSNGEDKNIILETDVFATLHELKTKGLLRAFGMSTKTIEGGKLAVDLSDVVMVSYNPLYADEKPVIDYANQKNKGVLIKKALASGHLTKIPGTDPVKTCIDFIFNQPGISSVIIGTINHQHLEQSVNYL